MPLFVFNLFIGCIFHFSIVFPYMNSLGFSTSQLVMYAIVTNIVVFMVEVPSGILADRWSRKGVLLASLVFMAIGCTLFGLADSYRSFMFATAITCLYFGMSSGLQRAILYDLLLERNRRGDYEKILGRLRVAYTVGLVISSLLGAVLASLYNFQIVFYLSVVSCVLGFIVLLFFKEPQLHRDVETVQVFKHIKTLFRLLMRRPETRLLVLNSVLIGMLFNFMLDVDPLWPIALGLATVWYGPLNALMLSSRGLAGFIAGAAATRLWLIRLLSAAVLLATTGLVVQNIYVVTISLFCLLTSTTVLMIILSGRIQDTLPSSQRSGSESAISTVAGLAFVISLPLFSYIAETQSVFNAAWILILIAALALIGMGRSFRRLNFEG